MKSTPLFLAESPFDILTGQTVVIEVASNVARIVGIAVTPPVAVGTRRRRSAHVERTSSMTPRRLAILNEMIRHGITDKTAALRSNGIMNLPGFRSAYAKLCRAEGYDTTRDKRREPLLKPLNNDLAGLLRLKCVVKVYEGDKFSTRPMWYVSQIRVKRAWQKHVLNDAAESKSAKPTSNKSTSGE